MEILNFGKKVIEKSIEAGFKESEIFYKKASSMSLSGFNKNIDSYKIDTTLGVGFRGIYNGKLGVSFTEMIDDESIDFLIQSAKDNSIYIENMDKEFIFNEKCEYKKLSEIENEDIDLKDKKNKLLELEKLILDNDNRITKVAGISYGNIEGEIFILNSYGIELSHKYKYHFFSGNAVCKDGENKRNGGHYDIKKYYNELDIEKLANKIAEKTVENIGAIDIKTKKYKIVLQNDAASSLLSTFSGIFSGELARKGLTLLKDKVGETIAADCVNIIDDPLLEEGFDSMPFDFEGVPTYRKSIVQDGKLLTLIHNLKTANYFGVKTTGNALRSGHESGMSVCFFNCFIENGNLKLEELMEKVSDGLLITSLSGLHAGANTISGDFSIAASGFIIKDGKKSTPIEQVTIASNFFDVLKSIELIANDLEHKSSIESPSLYIGELSVASKI